MCLDINIIIKIVGFGRSFINGRRYRRTATSGTDSKVAGGLLAKWHSQWHLHL